MKIDVLTVFPEMFEALNHSILLRAQNKGLLDISVHNIRDFSLDKNKRCDDYSYGGGAGMIMTPQPIFDAIKSVKTNRSHVIFMSPKGQTLTQEKVVELSNLDKDLIFLCGHYEGIDERIIDLCVDEELSIGDYVLTGGELPAMVAIDAISRYVPQVLGNSETTQEETFNNSLLEYPQYTRPAVFMGKTVPEVLLNGNHNEVENWRYNKALEVTKLRRPELFKKHLINNNLYVYNGKVLKEEENYKAILKANLDKLHFTKLSEERVKNNLKIYDRNLLNFVRNRVKEKRTSIKKIGKNLYCKSSNIIFTINANSYSIITAKIIK